MTDWEFLLLELVLASLGGIIGYLICLVRERKEK